MSCALVIQQYSADWPSLTLVGRKAALRWVEAILRHTAAAPHRCTTPATIPSLRRILRTICVHGRLLHLWHLLVRACARIVWTAGVGRGTPRRYALIAIGHCVRR